MTPLKRFVGSLTPFVLVGACAQIIGLSDYEKGDAAEIGDGGQETGGKMAVGGGGTGGSGFQKGGRGGTGASRGGAAPGGEAGESGDGGVAGDTGGTRPTGGVSGTGQGGATGGRGGTAGSGMGGVSGTAGSGAGNGGAGMNGGAGANGGVGGAGAGAGGMGGMPCTPSSVAVQLRNGAFESGVTNWTPFTDPTGATIIGPASSLGVTAETAPNIAHFGGADLLYTEIFQSIAIPAGATDLTVTGYRWITTDETLAGAFDIITIALYEDAFDASTLIDEFIHWSNLNPTNGWLQFSYTRDVSAYAGQVIDFDIWSDTDLDTRTDFYIDSLSLTARVCL